ncbi:MAG: hypothetical protein U1E67_15800 [Hyphomicrobiales bacterium]
MRPSPNRSSSERFTVDPDSTKLWPIVDPVDHRLSAYAAAMILVACVGYLINWAFA